LAKENTMTEKQGLAPDDVSSAPESGTVCDDTSGNKPSDRGYDPGQCASPTDHPDKDDPSIASEER
ncbi:MAG TPA: hypothetical protein VN688_25700, partial [Gemmataceae bacterium]|nr:hypothetical protein [Gemmataceae bacterium]